jgi:peptide/nickel transport system permease protein
MTRVILQRLGFYLIAAWAALTINFLVPRLMPGDPVAAMTGRMSASATPEVIDAMRKAFGDTDAPLYKQYATYLVDVARGDLGRSTSQYPARVSDVIAGGLVWTLALGGVVLVISFVIGTALGAIAAWRRSGWLDAVLPPVLALSGSFPYFWLAMLALHLFGFTLGWTALRHAYCDHLSPALSLTFIVDVIQHAFLPALTIIVATVGGWVLSMRNTMIGVLGTEQITFARAKGLSSRRILWAYAARNALLPNLTSFGMALGFVLGGSLLTEIVFSYPGTGYLLIQAVRTQDYPLMQGLFLSITLAVLAANFLVDLATLALDPRTRPHA